MSDSSRRPRWPAALAGVLTANAVPHLYAAATGAHQLTPLRGRRSGPAANLVWGALNLGAAGVTLLRTVGPADGDPGARRAFKWAVAGFSGWSLASEWLTELNG